MYIHAKLPFHKEHIKTLYVLNYLIQNPIKKIITQMRNINIV